MKKILGISLILLALSVTASAQNNRRHRPQFNTRERLELRQDALRYHMLERRVERDGRVTPFERRRLQKARMNTRRDAFRYRHNNRRRFI
jgi:hypothetical protein